MTVDISISGDFAGYLADYSTFSRAGWGWFNSNNPFDFTGDDYANSEAALPFASWNASERGFVAESVDGWEYSTGNIEGSLDHIKIGYGLTANSSEDFDTITTVADFDFGGVVADGEGTAGQELVYSFMTADLSYLESYLATEGTRQTGTTSDDVFQGFGGEDTFVFNDDVGADTVEDFDVSEDVIELNLNDTDYDSFAELSIANDANGDAVIDLGDYGSVTLAGVDAGDVAASNFAFTDAALAA